MLEFLQSCHPNSNKDTMKIHSRENAFLIRTLHNTELNHISSWQCQAYFRSFSWTCSSWARLHYGLMLTGLSGLCSGRSAQCTVWISAPPTWRSQLIITGWPTYAQPRLRVTEYFCPPE